MGNRPGVAVSFGSPDDQKSPQLTDFDRRHVWHPYSSATSPAPTFLVDSAAGTRLRLLFDGTPIEVIDAMSSWWCAIHGYAVPELDAAAQRPALAHEPRDVRRPDPRTRGRTGASPARPGAGWAGARLLRRLGISLGRGRDEDGVAGPRGERPDPHEDVHDPRRLLRRHVLADERVRPRRRDALDVRRARPAPRVRAAAAGGV